ncbi:MAG: alpha-mannosidase, partial [Clostridiales bacterium]|nr:alpha-mannosidase [Clostridiales bacterium]
MQQMYLIGIADIDPVWRWRKTEGMAEIIATFRSALDRMKEFDDFVFTSACASYYLWVEQVDAGMLEEIRQRVAEGRWCIAGGFWVQPDCNIPSGESFARHALYSQRYFLKTFGQAARVGYCVDSFGHNGMLPQLLSKSGMEGYVFMRPDARENPELPDLFTWESPDGSRVTAARIQMGYGDFHIPNHDKPPYAGMHLAAAKAHMLREKSVQEGLPRMSFYGIGNHGGGPTIAALEALGPVHEIDQGIRYAGVNDLFDDLQASGKADNLPLVTTDLQHHASGCYAALSAIKTANRRAECELTAAENLNTLSHLLTGEPLQPARLQDAWQMVLFNQFHDVLAGCCIKEAYDDALSEMHYARAVAQDILRLSAQRISWRVATSRQEDAPAQKNGWLLWEKQGEGAPVVILNPHAFPVRTLVQINARLAS